MSLALGIAFGAGLVIGAIGGALSVIATGWGAFVAMMRAALWS